MALWVHGKIKDVKQIYELAKFSMMHGCVAEC